MSIWDWIVLITLFFDTFGNILRYLPLLSGRPAEIESAKEIKCTGKAVLGCCTPIVSESEPVFLRGLIGRTATAFHTIGSRHSIQGLYMDTIINELRRGFDKRQDQWVAWIEFILTLTEIRTQESRWEHVPDEIKNESTRFGYLPDTLSDWRKKSVHARTSSAVKPQLAVSKTKKPMLVDDSSAKDHIVRSMHLKKILKVKYNIGVSIVSFEGLLKEKAVIRISGTGSNKEFTVAIILWQPYSDSE